MVQCEGALIFEPVSSMSSPSAVPVNAVHDGLAGRQHVLALIAILLSVAMATLDTAIANTALPTIAASLRVSEAQVIWVVNAYQLATIAAALPFAASGEILGHGRVFAAGTVVSRSRRWSAAWPIRSPRWWPRASSRASAARPS